MDRAPTKEELSAAADRFLAKVDIDNEGLHKAIKDRWVILRDNQRFCAKHQTDFNIDIEGCWPCYAEFMSPKKEGNQ